MNFSEKIKNDVRDCISNNELEDALSILEKHVQNQSLKNEIISIKRRFNHLKKQKRIGIIRIEDELIENNQITNSILELIDSKNNGGKKNTSNRPKSNTSQIILAICAIITIIFGYYKYSQDLNQSNEEKTIYRRDTIVVNNNIPIIQNHIPTFNQNPPIKTLYADFLDDFDIGTTMQFVRDKLGSPNYIEKDLINLFEDRYDLELERYSYHYENETVDIWSDSTKQKIEIIELHSHSEDIKFVIPTFSYVLELNGYEENKLGEINSNQHA